MSDTPKRHTAILSDALMDVICRAFEIPPDRVRRIVVDTQVGRKVSVYIEFVGDERLLAMDWPHFGPDDFTINRTGTLE